LESNSTTTLDQAEKIITTKKTNVYTGCQWCSEAKYRPGPP